jgi:hypothetical protein
MTYEDELLVRRRLDEVAQSVPRVAFGAGDLVRRGRRRRTVRRGLLAGTAVAAVALVAGVPVALLRSPGPDPVTATRPAPRPPSPSATPAPSRSATWSVGRSGPIPGVSAADAAAITRGCDRAYEGPGVLHLRNLVRDGTGVHALLYGPDLALSCDLPSPGDIPTGFGGGTAVSLRWLPGPVSVDLHSGDATSQTVAGRVTSAVAEVEVFTSGHSQRVRPVNGTYVARITGPGGQGTGTDLRVTARDGSGRTLGTQGAAETDCFTGPDGTVVIQQGPATTGCRPATPWR